VERIFVGSEALASGAINRYELRTFYKRVFPDVYGPRRGKLTLKDRTTAAWLWSRREAVVLGQAAAALHGAEWVDADIDIELNWGGRRAPDGVLIRRETLLDEEVSVVRGIATTTADRIAFDLARRDSVGEAVARLDALARATHFKAVDVQELARRHPHVKGSRRVDRVLDLVDERAESPKETWLRLVLIAAGFPRPQTQIAVPRPNGYPPYRLDMGWEDVKIAVEYDGDSHRERRRWRRDIVRSEYLARLGWIQIRIVTGTPRSEVVNRVRRAWALRSQ
jgi:hypothetical protein